MSSPSPASRKTARPFLNGKPIKLDTTGFWRATLPQFSARSLDRKSENRVNTITNLGWSKKREVVSSKVNHHVLRKPRVRDRGSRWQRGEHVCSSVGPRQPQAPIPCSRLHRRWLLRRPPRPIPALHHRRPQPRRHPVRWPQFSLSLSRYHRELKIANNSLNFKAKFVISKSNLIFQVIWRYQR